MKILALLLLVVVGLVSCAPDIEPGNKVANVQTTPEYVCTLSDGRVVYRFQVASTSTFSHVHYVYMFGQSGPQPMSVNRTVPQGKTTRNEVIVTVPAFK